MKKLLVIGCLLVLLVTACNKQNGAVPINNVSTENRSNGSAYQSKETKHFKIYYLEQDKDCLQDLSDGLETAYDKVTKDLDHQLSFKAEVTVCPDIDALHTAIGYVKGTGQDNYITAGTIGRHFYLVSPLNPGPVRDYEHMTKSSTLHEFTHIVINDMTGSDSWPTEVPRWLNEGVASYEGGPPMPESIMKQQIAQRVRNNQIPSFANMASYGQDFITSGGYFFTLPAGAFLVEQYGFEKVKKLILAPGSYEDVFGKSEEEIWNEWIEYLKKNYD